MASSRRKIDALGLGRRTLIVFTSDNGGPPRGLDNYVAEVDRALAKPALPSTLSGGGNATGVMPEQGWAPIPAVMLGCLAVSREPRAVPLLVALGNSFDPEGDLFKYHMPLGLLAGFFVVARIVFGIVGSRHARWTRFFFTPWHTARYLFDAVRFRSRSYAGINPGTSLVALSMYGVVAAVIYTGFAAEYVELWRGWLADALLWLIGLHLAGLVVHTLGHRDWLALSMITGQKAGPAADGLPRENWLGGWLFLALCLALAAAGYLGFDVNECVLRIPCLPPLYLPLVQKG